MKILYVTTISDTMGFFLEHINMLLDQGHTVDMACNIVKPINSELLERGCKIHKISFERLPIKKNNFLAYRKIQTLVLREGYDLIHTHTPVASCITRCACRNIPNLKIFYTAHGFHFYKGAPLINWLLYYPVEKFLSRYTDVLITINKEDYNRAKKSFKAGKVEYIPGVGLDTKKFSKVVVDKSEKRKEIDVPENAFVILSVGELNKNKNHETIVKALARLNNSNIYYVICGQGPLKNHLKDLAKKLRVENQVKLLGYRKDTAEICKTADVFAFPSRREGLGLAALEAMASGLPIITSNVQGIVNYSINGITGYTCNPNDVDGFAKAIDLLMYNKETRAEMSRYNINAVKKFDLQHVIRIINEIYKDFTGGENA